MTRDDIIRMAREAGFRIVNIELHDSDPLQLIGPRSATDCMPELVRFAAIVAAAEREACAKGCETSVAGFGSETEWADGYIQAAKDIAEGIRARGAA